MATNRNAVLRYNTLDRCFRNPGRRYYFEDLLESVNESLRDFDPLNEGIKTRQLRDDIRFMKSEAGYSAPIESFKDGRKAYYRYLDINYSINNSPLNQTEAELLKDAISIFTRFEGAPQFEWIRELRPILIDHFGLQDNDKKVIGFDSNVDYSGHSSIQPLFNAIINKQVLEIEYEPFDKEAFTFNFHPYYLKQYNNRWFVFGLNEALSIPTWILALDRIRSIRVLDSDYIDSDINWDDHFYDIVGVSTPDEGVVEKIELEFIKEQANYIKTKPIHPSQKSYLLEDGKLKVILSVKINYELQTMLLSFGEKVRIVSPNSLKISILRRLKEANELYY